VLEDLGAGPSGTEERLRREWPGLPDAQAMYAAYR
jgi:hypothetical protein